MFFILSKILHFLISPLIWAIALLLWALLTKSAKRKKTLLIITCSLLYFFANPFINDEAFRWYEERNPTYDEIAETYDVVVVLGGFTSFDDENGLEGFHASTDRFLHGLKLYKTGKAKKIMLVGGSGSIANPDEKEGVIMAGFLADIGVPMEDIIIEKESKNTRENAVNAAKILNNDFVGGKFLLVTSGYHMPRAKRCFQKVGIAVTPFSVDHYAGKRKFIFDHLFLPNPHTIAKWETLFHEWVGFITYKVLGYV